MAARSWDMVDADVAVRLFLSSCFCVGGSVGFGVGSAAGERIPEDLLVILEY